MQHRPADIYTSPSRILLATDLTNLKQILSLGISYAQKWKAALKLIHVLPEIDMQETDSNPQAIVHGRQQAERILEDAAKEARKIGVTCTWIVRSGQVAPTIAAMVEEWRADWLVIGPHGPQKFRQEILGSVAESILREVDIPILAVGPQVQHSGKHSSKKCRILFTTALDRGSLAIAESVVRFARAHHAELTMLHVMPEIAKAHPSAVRVRAYAEHKFQQILSDVSADTPLPLCMIERGPIVETIHRVAKQGYFDLILLGGISGSSFRTDIMPGTAYGVVCGAPCPVLILKEDLHRISTRLPAA